MNTQRYATGSTKGVYYRFVRKLLAVYRRRDRRRKWLMVKAGASSSKGRRG